MKKNFIKKASAKGGFYNKLVFKLLRFFWLWQQNLSR